MKKRQKQQLVRGGLYVLFVVVIVAVIWIVDIPRFVEFFLNREIAADLFPEIITIALKNTILYTIAAFILGLIGGLALALMKMSPIGPYRWFANIYIEFFRGLPALLVIFLFGYGIPFAFQIRVNQTFIGVLALAVVAAAYMAETIRAGIEAVPKGQIEAARSLGMTQTRATVSIVIPQAFRIIIPPLTNEVVLLTKDTSLLFILGSTPIREELVKFGRDELFSLSNPTPLVVAGLMYLVITLPLTQVVAALERRNNRAR